MPRFAGAEIERIRSLGRSPRRLAVASGAATVVLAGALAMLVGGDSLSYPVERRSAATVRVERCSHVPRVPLSTDVVVVLDPRAASREQGPTRVVVRSRAVFLEPVSESELRHLAPRPTAPIARIVCADVLYPETTTSRRSPR